MSQPLIDLQSIFQKALTENMVLDDLNLSVKENSFRNPTWSQRLRQNHNPAYYRRL